MFGINLRSPLIKYISHSALLLCLSWGLIGCRDRLEAASPIVEPVPVPVNTSQLSEVAPPPVIQELRQVLAQYQPQVKILSPKPGETFSETTVAVQLQVKDYPLFKDAQWGLGPHLHFIVDNEPYQAIYDVDEPIILTDLSPGTHTLRVFASRPWHESFKNEGAYAQTTFNIFTATEENAPDASLPLLTYSRPKGSYGAEPIMLDFYLTNAPLHFVAQDNPEDDIVDWRIKVTINGESFLLDTWQPLYLKGFETGKNWIQLEFLDEQGNEVNNAFNNTVRLITYEPNGQDTLSKLVRGELSAEIARSIVDANYSSAIKPEPEETETPVEETPETVEPSAEETVTEELEQPAPETPVEETPETVEPSVEETVTEELEQPAPETPVEPSVEETVTEEAEIESEVTTKVEEETTAKASPSQEVTQETASEETKPQAVSPVEVVLPPTTPETIEEQTVPTSEPSSPPPVETATENQESTLSDMVEANRSSTEELPSSNQPQWLENLVQSLKRINLTRIMETLEGLKNQLIE